MNFNIGDTVWLAQYGQRAVEVTCPVCFGNKRVVLVLGNGDEMSLECGACQGGGEPPRGTVTEYQYIASAIPIVIDGLEIRQTAFGEERKYRCGWCNANAEDLFAIEAEALARSQQKVVEQEAEQASRQSTKHKPGRSYSWNAGYHMTEAKRARQKVEFHEQKAVLCKARSKQENAL